MNTQPMPTRDLVLRLCDEPTELNQGWLASGEKVAVPVPVPSAYVGGPPRAELARAVVGAARTMGADELLACRTRAEHMYEPVDRVPARADDLARTVGAWGDQPEETLFALSDQSAAVLVTTGGVMLVAGPVPFVQAMVGADIAAAKERFGEYALRQSDDLGLLRLAEQYGCLDAQAGDDADVPRADTAERLARTADRLRENSPGLVGTFRLLRTLTAWAAVVLVIVVTASVPDTSRVIPCVIGLGWLVVQLCVLCRSRTVTLAVCLRTVVLGALVCLPTVLVERGVVAAMGATASDPIAAVQVGAPLEEVAKLVPVVCVWWFARRRFKRLAAADYLLLAAASGAGFQLVENTVLLLVSGPSNNRLGFPQFAFFQLLPGWTDGVDIRFAGHAVLTGLVGACAGLAAVGSRRYGRKLWLVPAAALALVIFDHLAFDALLRGLHLVGGTDVAYALLGHGFLLRPLFLLALVACVLLDHRAFRAVDDVVPPLPGTPRWTALERLARGIGIRIRARVPHEAAPVFHRLAGALAGLVVTFAEATVRIWHEWAVMLVALARGGSSLPSALRFIRDRRELAMSAYRAAGRPRRDVPPRAEVRRMAEAVTGALGLAACLAGAAVLTGAAVAPARGSAFLALYVDPLLDWLGRHPPAQQVLTYSGGVALLVLLLCGWTLIDVRAPGRDAFLRDPRGSTTAVFRDLTPGRIPYLLLWLAGLAVPGTVDVLLSAPVAQAPVPAPPMPGRRAPAPPDDAALVITAPPGGPGPLPDETWEFPTPALNRALKFATDFGATQGTSFDAPALRAALLSFLIEPDPLRMDITFAGRAARAVVDRARGRTVIFTPTGEFLTCLTLTESQLSILLAEHQL